jgi:hypothetical protein
MVRDVAGTERSARTTLTNGKSLLAEGSFLLQGYCELPKGKSGGLLLEALPKRRLSMRT